MPIAKPCGPVVAENSPAGDLLAALEPYLWVEITDDVRIWGPGQPPWHFRVRGIVKMQGEPSEGTWEPGSQEAALILANDVRASLFGTAQTAICAAEGCGYVHWQHPDIRITGGMRHQRQRHIKIPIARCDVEMWLTPAT